MDVDIIISGCFHRQWLFAVHSLEIAPRSTGRVLVDLLATGLVDGFEHFEDFFGGPVGVDNA